MYSPSSSFSSSFSSCIRLRSSVAQHNYTYKLSSFSQRRRIGLTHTPPLLPNYHLTNRSAFSFAASKQDSVGNPNIFFFFFFFLRFMLYMLQ